MGSAASKSLDRKVVDLIDIQKYETEESIYAKFKQKSFNRLKTISETFAERKVPTDEDSIKSALREMMYISELYFKVLDKVNRQKGAAFRKDVAQFIIDSNLFDFISSVLEAYQMKSDSMSELLCSVLHILFNYSDASDAFAEKISASKVLETCRTILEEKSEGYIEMTFEGDELEEVENCIGIVHNVSLRDENVETMRKMEFVNVLQPYMKSTSYNTKLACLTTLANIVNEDECDIIKANTKSVSRLLKVLEKGLNQAERRYKGWSCKECALAVRQLAKNDANKKILWNLGAIPVLVRLADENDEEEQLEAVGAIWSLAFDKEIREDIVKNKELKVVDLLVDLEQSSENKVLKSACERCLWTLLPELENSQIESYTEAVEKINLRPKTKTKEDKGGHIMISYQSAHRDVLKRIRDKLKERNYKVWIDVDEMEGSTLQAMANAIEKAAVVLICYSRRYKESQYCQSEAEYAYNRKQCIIPLKMERDYNPDGWLGILLGQKYFVEFSGKYDFDLKFKDLLKQIHVATEKSAVDLNVTEPKAETAVVSAPPAEITSYVTSSPGVATKTKKDALDVFGNLYEIRNWTDTDVCIWLEKHKLQNTGLDHITGEEISLLAKMQVECPDHMYNCIKRDLKVNSLLDKSRLVWALYELTKAKNGSKLNDD